MGGIPLVALLGRPPQIRDWGEQQNLNLQNQRLQGENALQPGQLEAQQNDLQMQKMQLEQAKRQQQDSQTVQDLLQQNNGDFEKTLPQLAGKVSFPTYQALQKAHLEHVKTLAEIDEKQLSTEKYHADQLSALGDQASKLSDEDYQSNWASIAQKADAIRPNLGLDPNNPMPRQQFAASLLGLKTTAQYLDQEKARREAQKAQEEAVKAQQGTEEFQAKKAAGTLAGPVNETNLAVKAAQGDETAEAALKRLDKSKRESRPINVTNMGASDVKSIADAIENGDQPPTLQGLYRNGGPVRAELARRGVPIAKMEMDWNATKKFLSTLNGPQQTRLRQDISVVADSLDKVEGLYDEWKKLAPTSGYKLFNKASLAAMKQLPGRPGAVAQALEAQIADTTAGLGTIYMGGNSPTDHSLGLAAKSLSADWNDATFTEALKQARANVKIRQNSILHAQPAGVSSDSSYPMPQDGGSAARTTSKSAYTPPAGAKTATGANGHKIVVDGGKWVDAETGAPI